MLVKQVKACVETNLNPMEKSVLHFSVTDFYFVKPNLIKHGLLVWMGYKLTHFVYFVLSFRAF